MAKKPSEMATPSPHEFLLKYQNPYFYPVFDPRYPFDLGTEITIGDLHANLMSLINLCIYHGIFALARKDYATLRRLFFTKAEDITKEHLLTFQQTLAKAKTSETNSKGYLRFLGDVMGDRVGNDVWFVLFLMFLHTNGIVYRIIFSNHDYEMIFNYEQQCAFGSHLMHKLQMDDAQNPFIHSMMAMQNLIDRGIITRNEIDGLLAKYYFPHLTCIDYSLSKDNRLTWYTHSYTSADTVALLARVFRIKSPSENIKCTDVQLQTQVLEEIQEKFKAIIKDRLINVYVGFNYMETALGTMIWGRTLKQPQEAYDLRILHVNGHDTQQVPANYINIDPIYGKEKIPFAAYKSNFSFNKFYYTHESKKLNHWYFKPFLDALKEKIPALPFSAKELATIFNETDLYSSYHIDCLHFFLFDEKQTPQLWKTLSAIQLPQDLLRMQILKKVYLREIIYLLHQLQADTVENILAVIGNSDEEQQYLFVSLLMLKDYYPNKINAFLACTLTLEQKCNQYLVVSEMWDNGFLHEPKFIAEPEVMHEALVSELKEQLGEGLAGMLSIPYLYGLKCLYRLNASEPLIESYVQAALTQKNPSNEEEEAHTLNQSVFK